MSSLDRRTLIKLGLASSTALALAACFRPMYGPTASGGNLAAILASIEVQPLNLPLAQEEFANDLRSELIYMLNGSGVSTPKRYKLKLSYSEGAGSPIIDSETGRALTATITGTVEYTLVDSDGKTIAAQGRAQSMVTYDRPAQRFASLRARRDAYKRLATELAEHIKTRLALVFSGR